MSEQVIPFPDNCPRVETCMQAPRIAVLEQRANNGRSQMDRIEEKIDGIRNWLLGAVLSVLIAVISALVVAVVKHLNG